MANEAISSSHILIQPKLSHAHHLLKYYRRHSICLGHVRLCSATYGGSPQYKLSQEDFYFYQKNNQPPTSTKRKDLKALQEYNPL